MSAPVRIPVRQGSPEWLEARRSGIGASEIAAACGVSPWESPYSLWARKCGLAPEPETSPAMELGTLMEPVVAELYTRQTGVRLQRRPMLYRHPRHRWMLASLDRVRRGGIVEVKHTADGRGWGEPGSDEVPEHYLVQVVAQMAVMDAPEVDLAVLVGGRAPVRVYTVRRDPALEAIVIERGERLWGHVESRTQPAVDGSEATLDALSEAYPADDGTELEADEDAAAWLALYLEADEAAARHQATRDLARASLEARMGEAAALRAPGVGHITWKASKPASQTAWAEVARAMAAADPERFAALVSANTKAKRAARPFIARREQAQEEQSDGE